MIPCRPEAESRCITVNKEPTVPLPSSLCVYCGSRFGTDPSIREAAVKLGELIAGKGITLVYGGGGVGLMGLVANAALGGPGEVVGIIPSFLLNRAAGT